MYMNKQMKRDALDLYFEWKSQDVPPLLCATSALHMCLQNGVYGSKYGRYSKKSTTLYRRIDVAAYIVRETTKSGRAL